MTKLAVQKVDCLLYLPYCLTIDEQCKPEFTEDILQAMDSSRSWDTYLTVEKDFVEHLSSTKDGRSLLHIALFRTYLHHGQYYTHFKK